MVANKKVPEIRFKGFAEDWKQYSVGDLLEERNIQTPKSDKYPLMAFIQNQGVAPKGDRYNRDFLVNDVENKKYKQTEKGDFIYSSNNLETGSIGLNNYGNAVVSPVYSIFKPTRLADSSFIGKSFQRKKFINDMLRWRQGVVYGQWKIHESDFIQIDTFAPEINEQKKIGRCLSNIDNLITLHQRKLEILNNIKQSMLDKMFPKKSSKTPEMRFKGFNEDWEQLKFEKLCSIITKQTGFDYTSTIKKSLLTVSTRDTLPYLQTKNFTGINIDYNTDYYIPKKIARDFPKINLNEKCLLFSIVGASVGNIGFFSGEKHCFLSGAICVSKFLDLSDAEYLYHYMCSHGGQDQIQTCTKGGAQATITIEDIRNFNVNLPLSEERIKIGKILSSIDNLIILYQHKLEKLNNIKRSMLDKMFV